MAGFDFEDSRVRFKPLVRDLEREKDLLVGDIMIAASMVGTMEHPTVRELQGKLFRLERKSLLNEIKKMRKT